MQSLPVVCTLLFLSAGRLECPPGNVEAISVRSQQQQRPHHVAGIGGATSTHWSAENSSLVIGTKKGGIFWSAISGEENSVTQGESDDRNEKDLIRWKQLKSNEYKTKYPIYSMTVVSPKIQTSPSPDNVFLFCGSGDRWISVWRLTPHSFEDSGNHKFVQRLGPHTGWVKDLIYDDSSRLLHSIGCNCIETWDCSRLGQTTIATNPNAIISHVTKRAIENSPTMGTTLSSDLLCLCLLQGDGLLPRLLVTGGVDGRIHLWLSDPRSTIQNNNNLESKDPLHTTLAHDGRVNKVIYSSATNTIFTVGNDGNLCVFQASIDGGFEMVSKLQIDAANKSLRITVASITSESENQGTCSLVLGSAQGEVYFVTANVNDNGGIDACVDGDCTISIGEDSMIYSIASQKDSEVSRIWIGHASGLSTFDRYF